MSGPPDETNGFRFRRARKGDEEAIVRLLERAFDRWPRLPVPVPPVDHLRWKLGGHPGSHASVVERGARVVGSFVVVARPALVAGRPMVCRDNVDNAIDPEYRGTGLYSRFILWLSAHARGADFEIGYTTSPEVVRIMEVHRGYRPPGNPLRTIVRPLPRLGRLFGPSPDRRIAIVDAEPSDPRLDELWRRASKAFDLILERSARTLAWRYGDLRAGRFVFRAAEEDGRLAGYAVHRLAGRRALLADLFAAPDREDVVRALVADVVASAAAAGARAVVGWTPKRHPYRATLRRQGFVSVGRRMFFAWRPLDAPLADFDFLADPDARLHLAMGDSDWA